VQPYYVKLSKSHFVPFGLFHLDGSVSANGDGGAGFTIFVHGMLRVADAAPAGQGVSDL